MRTRRWDCLGRNEWERGVGRYTIITWSGPRVDTDQLQAEDRGDMFRETQLAQKVWQQLQARQKEKRRERDAIEDARDDDKGEHDGREEGRVLLLPVSRQACCLLPAACCPLLAARCLCLQTLFSTIRRRSTSPQSTSSVSMELEKV